MLIAIGISVAVAIYGGYTQWRTYRPGVWVPMYGVAYVRTKQPIAYWTSIVVQAALYLCWFAAVIYLLPGAIRAARLG